MKLSIIFGTRPELIKLAPLIQAVKPNHQLTVICTGQHRELLCDLFEWFDIKPDLNLDLMIEGQSPLSLLSRSLDKLHHSLPDSDYALIQGDTMSAFAGALAAFYKQIPIAHLEAGLRSGRRYNPFPEEMIRRQISCLADIHLAPTARAADSLQAENHKNIYQVGNTVIDALKDSLKKKPEPTERLKPLIGKKFILLTVHRYENRGKPYSQIARAIRRIAGSFPELEVLFPMHPNPQVKEHMSAILSGHPRIHLIDPLAYPEMIWSLKNCYLIATDSGGLQEEASYLGKPTLILRENTERPEVLEAGTARLVDADEEKIFNNARELLLNTDSYERASRSSAAFGDGDATAKILQILSNSCS